ncbi:MAG: hypothetical protein MZV65_45305, partial [Chromatiales bacterium]|nr:hypothetical protein [Chromatiales bacterium]
LRIAAKQTTTNGIESKFRRHISIWRCRACARSRPGATCCATTNGVSAIIDTTGVIGRSPQFVTHVLTGEARPFRGATLHVRAGNAPVLALVLLVLVFGMYWARRRPVRQESRRAVRPAGRAARDSYDQEYLRKPGVQ